MHRSVRALEAAIDEFIAAHNADGAPFAWIKTADEILASIARFAGNAVTVTAWLSETLSSAGDGPADAD